MSDAVAVPMIRADVIVGEVHVDRDVAADLDLIGSGKRVTSSDGRRAVHRGVLLHRLVVGLYPRDRGVVHHLNRNPRDNRRANLWVCADAIEHRIWHGGTIPHWHMTKVARRYQESVEFTQPRLSLYSNLSLDPLGPYDDVDVFWSLHSTIGFHILQFPESSLRPESIAIKHALIRRIMAVEDGVLAFKGFSRGAV